MALIFAGLAVCGQTQGRRPKVALVLEGGGALGFAHIGALEYLEQHQISWSAPAWVGLWAASILSAKRQPK